MRSIVIGTAGHIDHGKTALVKALTGIDTDRLKEEKSRGITIELGFAHMQLDSQLQASIVDVPGHERFVRSMVAGTTGIDMVLMVVAADEAVMPQTREHLDICNILGVERGLVALTKIDLIDDPDWIDMVTQELRTELKGSFLADSPIIAVSSRTGQGLDALTEATVNMGKKVPSRTGDACAFLAIDRSFSMRGFGTVVTGTLTSGSFKADDIVDILPDRSGRLAGMKIRGLQVHGKKVEQAEAGQRTAINLSGIDHSLLSRGQVVAHTDTLRAVSDFACTLQLVPGTKPFRSRTRAVFHTGTTRSMATVRLLDANQLTQDQQAFAAIHCDTPVVALPRHRYILRGSVIIEARGTTMGGGEILAGLPPRRHRKNKQSWLQELTKLKSGDNQARLEVLFQQAGSSWLDLKELGMASGLDQAAILSEVEKLISEKKAIRLDGDQSRFVSTQATVVLCARSKEILGEFHRHNPMLPGMPAEQLRQSLRPKLDTRVFKLVIEELIRQGAVAQDGELARLTQHRVKLSESDTELETGLRDIYEQAKLAPPTLDETASQVNRTPGQVLDMIKHLTRTGLLTHVSGQMYVTTKELDQLRSRLISFLKQNHEISIQDFKTLVASSRKHVIPLAEFFDQEKTTLRVGQKRVLRRK